MRASWHGKKDPDLAKRSLTRLERVLKSLPDNDLAIIREEGWAWFHQIRGDTALAIKHRRQEIQLIEKLYDSVRRSVKAGDYDESMARSILADRDVADLKERQAILHALLDQQAKNKRAGGKTPVRARAESGSPEPERSRRLG
jgi:hypothetical protein